MTFIEKIENLWKRHSKILTVTIAVVLSISFVLSIVFAIFSGDELKKGDTASKEAKGIMRFGKSSYLTSYFEGDQFYFDITSTEIVIKYKDPETEQIVSDDDLSTNDYGFMINGEGDIINDSKNITIDKTIKCVSVVYKKYPNLHIDIPIKVLDVIDEESLSSKIVYEAEDADLYEGSILLSEEDKGIKPSTDKPYRSDKGNIDGLACSGGACLRNFQNRDMRVYMEIICTEEQEVELEVMLCKRKTSDIFGKYYLFTVNGEQYADLDKQVIPAGSGYFTPYTLNSVKIRLKRGINTIEFCSGVSIARSNPANLDGIVITAEKPILAIYKAPTEAVKEAE